MADEKLSQLPSGTAIQNADLSYWDQSTASVSQPASAISTYVNAKLPVGSATQQGIVEVDNTTITASSGVITAALPTGANPSATAGPAAVNGTATTFMRSDGAPAIQKASATQFGIVEVDNTTITAAAGVITAVQPTGANPSATAGPAAINGSATTFMRSDGAPAVQKASATQFGIVEVDGTTITAVGGVISSTGGGGGTGANPTATAGPVAVNGTATTFLRSDGAPAVQLGTAAQKGLVQVDGTTITASAGVISAVQPTGANPSATAGPTAVNGSAATFMRSDGAPAVQKATASQFGIVEVDGTSITAVSGVISATGGLPLAGGNLTFFVAKTGSDSNPGTVGSPFLTVQHAANVAGGFNYQGQFSVTINVGAGTFNESGAAGLGLQPPELVGLPQFTLGLIQGAGIASTTVQSTGAQGLSLSGFGCQWKFGDITFDCPSVACGVGNGATANFGAGTSSSFTDSTSGGFFSPFYCFNGGFIGAGSGSTLTFPVGFHFNFVLLEGFEPYADFSNSTLVFPSSDFGTPGTDAIVTSDLSGGAAADGYLEWRSVTVTNAAHYKGSQVIAAGVPFLVVWTDNGLLSDLPGTATGNQTDNRTLVSKGGQTLPLAVQLSAAPTTSDLFEGTFGTFKDASGPRFIAMTDGGVTYTRQIGNFINAQTGTSYTLALLDQEGIVQMSNASANTLTVPTNASVAFPIGTEIQVVQQGAGATTIAAAGGVTLNGAGALAGQFKSALLYKSATNTWTQINTGGSGGGGGTPGGANTDVQFNNSGAFGGDSGFTYAGSGGQLQLNSNGILTSPATATWQLGAADAASPVAQFLKVQNAAAGNNNVSGGNFTFGTSMGTGTGAPGNFAIEGGFTGLSGTSTVTITIASPAVVTWTNHLAVRGQAIKFSTTGALPTGITAGTTYYMLNIANNHNDFNIAATPNGTPINTTGTQSGVQTGTFVVNAQNTFQPVATFGKWGGTGSGTGQFALNLQQQLQNTDSNAKGLLIQWLDINSNGGHAIELQYGAANNDSFSGLATVFYVNQAGDVHGNQIVGSLCEADTQGFYNRANNQPYRWGSSDDTTVYRDGTANILAMSNGTNAQAWRVYNTTDTNGGTPTNYERGAFDWTTTANTLTIGAQAGGTGTLRGVSIVGASLKMGSAGMFTANGAVATTLGSVGPTGASTTVTKWLTIVDNGGTTRYIPCF